MTTAGPLHARQTPRAGHRIGWWPDTALSWIVIGFVIAALLAAATLGLFGAAGRGTSIALKVTARWSFVLFWVAYTGAALARLFGSRFAGLARRGRDFGLAFASAQLIHVGLVLWLYVLSAGPGGAMLLFWAGIACTYLLALFSLPKLQHALGRRLWKLACAMALDYIALVFAVDFILLPLGAQGAMHYPVSYIPFALMLIAGFGLRGAAAFARIRPTGDSISAA